MTTWTLLLFVLHAGAIQMPGFATMAGCQQAEVSVSRELHRQLQDTGAADLILTTCVKVTK